jgi:hypothetical protein
MICFQKEFSTHTYFQFWQNGEKSCKIFIMRISNDQRLVYHLFFPFQVGFSYLEKLQV